jgi:hypothetical protein
MRKLRKTKRRRSKLRTKKGGRKIVTYSRAYLGQDLNTDNFLSLEKIKKQREMLGRINTPEKRKLEKELNKEEEKTSKMIESLMMSLEMYENQSDISEDLQEQINYLKTEFNNSANQTQIEIPHTIETHFNDPDPTGKRKKYIIKNLPKGLVSSSSSNGLVYECVEGICKLITLLSG